MRIADRLTENFSVKSGNNIPTPMLQKKEVKENHYKARPNKVQHDNLQNSRTRAAHVNKELTEKWLNNVPFSTYIEGYLFAIQEEEINANNLKNKGSKYNKLKPSYRLCHTKKKENYATCYSCLPKIDAIIYLTIRHNKVGKIILDNVILKTSNNIQKNLSTRKIYRQIFT